MPPKRTSKEQKLADNNQKEQKLADNNQKGIGIEKSERKIFELYLKDDEMGEEVLVTEVINMGYLFLMYDKEEEWTLMGPLLKRTSKEQKLADNNQKGIGIEKGERKTFELYLKDNKIGLITV
ncbi:hypothetical protein C2G38_2205098 [Gigaspora rosea]|uniref:Uncharacterized protein n=1 Tax=Gigaspora rosea TaxID=44941 RepID=A0A397UMV2_9GLOM|nr:hypothetical protein C2G38_2205098 [Gigaspora rosea]